MPRLGKQLVALVAAALALTGTPALADGRVDATVTAVTHGVANACRNLNKGDLCKLVDGRVANAAHMNTYEKSWTHRALTLQRQLDDDVAFARSTMPHTHNSFNSSVYAPPTVTNLDPNQIYSMYDQLRMDVRAIEMDVHWVPSIHGTAKTGFNAVTLCHGQVQLGVHVGCSIDRPLASGLAELKNWLDRPGNENEVVLLYLENNLDDNVTAHNLVASTLTRTLGDRVARPPKNKPSAPLPTSTTPAALRSARHHVIIVGNCGPGAWGSWVFEHGPATNWEESGSDAGNDYPGLRTGCVAERKRTHTGSAIVRWFEDSTFLSAIVGGSTGQLTPTEATAMANCGATLIGFDQLTPEDPRLSAIVWSWAHNEPRNSSTPQSATSTSDTHFHAAPCAHTHAFTCALNPDVSHVTTTTGSWSNGAAASATQFPGSKFETPRNGWENSLLRTAAGQQTVWMRYADQSGKGTWTTT